MMHLFYLKIREALKKTIESPFVSNCTSRAHAHAHACLAHAFVLELALGIQSFHFKNSLHTHHSDGLKSLQSLGQGRKTLVELFLVLVWESFLGWLLIWLD